MDIPNCDDEATRLLGDVVMGQFVENVKLLGRNFLVTVHGPVNPAVEADVALVETRAVLERIRAGRLSPATGSWPCTRWVP